MAWAMGIVIQLKPQKLNKDLAQTARLGGHEKTCMHNSWMGQSWDCGRGGGGGCSHALGAALRTRMRSCPKSAEDLLKFLAGIVPTLVSMAQVAQIIEQQARFQRATHLENGNTLPAIAWETA